MARRKSYKRQIKKIAKKNPKGFIILTTIGVIAVAGLISYDYFNGKPLGLFLSSSSNNISYETNIENANLEIHFMQLGNNKNGDAIYIKAYDQDILIDAGVSNASTIQNYMNNFVKDKKLEYVIATHADSDHIEGFHGTNANPGIFYSYTVDNLIDFSYMKAEKYQSIENPNTVIGKYNIAKNHLISNGTKYKSAKEFFNEDQSPKAEAEIILGENLSMHVLYNKYYFENSTDDENNYSVNILFKYKEQKFLFTGDLEKEGEKAFVEYYQNSSFLNNVNVYKASHHGSKTSSNTAFLNLINPQTCIISASAGNPEYTSNYLNVFPCQDFIDRISKHTDNVYITSYGMDNEEKAMNGNILVSSNGDEIALNASNNLTKLKDSDWFNSTIYVDDKNNFTPSKANKNYYTKDDANVHPVPFRTW